MPRKILTCNCESPDHLIILNFCEETRTLDVFSSLNHYLPWWKRVVHAFKYIFGIDNTYYNYSEVVLNEADIEELIIWLGGEIS